MLLYTPVFAANPGVITNVLAQGRTIKGITVLDNKLFIIRNRSPVVEIYDTMEHRALNNVSVDGLANPNDITSCRNFRYIYIADSGDGMDGIPSIHRLEVDGRTSLGDVSRHYLAVKNEFHLL
jgi:hypothetical protein